MPSMVQVTNPQTGAAVFVPSIANVKAQYAVVLNQMEQTRASLYDSAAYPAAGLSSLSFFQTPVGAGTGFGGSTKTLSDTNMQLAGQLPATQMFLVENIEIKIQPSTPSGGGILDPGFLGAAISETPVNDVWFIARSGNLQFKIADKNYVQDAPLDCFPPYSALKIDAALSNATTAAASLSSQIAFAQPYGIPYNLDPNNLLLQPTMAFGLTLAWPEGVQAIGKPARIFAKLNGTLYRQVQ